MADIATSILARLKNESKKEKIPLQQLLNIFCQEEFIRRLSSSPFKGNLVLKGGFLLYSMSGFTSRPTIDADYLLKNYKNDLGGIEKLIIEIIDQTSQNDYISFEIRSLQEIGNMRKYPGVRINLVGNIGKTKTPFSLDIGVGDVIVPSPVVRTLPTILAEFEKPEILTYSLESTVAEKLDAIVSLMEATGRMKDFYDIYYVATNFDFEGKELKEAIYETLTNRATQHEEDSVLVIKRLADNIQIQQRWNNFCKKILQYDLDLGQVISLIIDFMEPPFRAMIVEEAFVKNWSYKEREYY